MGRFLNLHHIDDYFFSCNNISLKKNQRKTQGITSRTIGILLQTSITQSVFRLRTTATSTSRNSERKYIGDGHTSDFSCSLPPSPSLSAYDDEKVNNNCRANRTQYRFHWRSNWIFWTSICKALWRPSKLLPL